LINNFYKARWAQFFTYVNTCMQQHKPVDEKYFDEKMKDWEWQWVNGHELYAATPQGNAVATAKELYAKYSGIVKATYN